ncbi:hypothetical protein M8C21_019389 [Ambrosia artemisiifolia]|uniref:Uncharacterized protein n=1 Tax=Ambrosia artemisiifolia TaxID=4212 RepID=A0AAD5GSN0_AMBAR|nr:hypothetical protein M8C21_019389 [Ambrosia artemisiifolia]
MKKMAVETDFDKVFENFRKRCLELEEKSKTAELRCLILETEVENLKKKNEELEGKIAAVQAVVIDPNYVKDDSETLLEVMIENKVLECEKRKAESDVCFWKEKVKELELKMKGMNERVEGEVDVGSRGGKDVFHRKRLSFEEGECPNKLGPSTPGVGQSTFHGVIDTNDGDDNTNEISKVKNLRKCDGLTKSQCSSENTTNLEHPDEEHTDEFAANLSNTRSAKRKRAANIVTSDDEDSYDDNAPICTLKTQHNSQVSTDSEEEVKDKSSIDLFGTFSSSEDEEYNDGIDESESEGGSLDGFIVDSSGSLSNCDSESSDSTDVSEDALNEYKATLDMIGRKKISNMKWDLEGDMLSDFGKDPALCMSAVCAVYRQQTADEQASKETIYRNKRGFSQADAWRASKLADFLMDGDSNGDLKKTVEELKQYDSEGIKLCRKLATTYSNQLFQIYQNKEDPYFPPQS